MSKQVRHAWLFSSGIFIAILLLGYWYHVELVQSLGHEFVYDLTMCEARVTELEDLLSLP
jgi:hypothetical protein